MRSLVGLGAFLVLTAAAGSTAHAQVELKNDSFVDGGVVFFHDGFVATEIGASRFVAPDAGRQLLKVRLLFGPTVATRDITLKVWDDTAGTADPGVELHTGDFQIVGSADAISELDVSADNIILPQQFRVGIVFTATGEPCIASDDSGIAANRNYILAQGVGWREASTLLVDGDFVIRAEVSGGGGGSPDAAPGSPDAAASGGECDGNSQCPVGSYCDVANHVCTFDCREDTDCSGDTTCSTLGQCVTGGGGGGCQTDRGAGGAGGLLLAGLGLLVLVARRR